MQRKLFKGMLCLAFCLAMAMLVTPFLKVKADSYGKVAINKNNFPDDVFRTYISDEFDENLDGYLTVDEIAKVTDIFIAKNSPYKNISSVKGIEFFPFLEDLTVTDSCLTELDVSKNFYLKRIDCKYGDLANLDISNNIFLNYVIIQKPSKEFTIDISNNPFLYEILLDNNGSISKAKNIIDNFTPVEISATVFPDDVFREIVSTNYDSDSDGFLSKREIAKVTHIGQYQLTAEGLGATTIYTDKTITNWKGIEVFKGCQSICIYPINDKISVDISKNLALKTLYFYSDGINNGDISSLDFSNNKLLTSLVCSRSKVGNIDLSNNIYLQTLKCDGCSISNLNVDKNIFLSELLCNSNSLKSIDVTNNVLLKEFQCCFNKLKELDISKNIFLEKLYCDGNELRELNTSNNVFLERLDCSDNKLEKLDLSNNRRIRLAHCYNYMLTELDIRNVNMDNVEFCAPSGTVTSSGIPGKRTENNISRLIVTDKDAIKITNQPKDVHVSKNSKVSLSAEAVGEGLTYMWQQTTVNSDNIRWGNNFFVGNGDYKSLTGNKVEFVAQVDKNIRCLVIDKYGNRVATKKIRIYVDEIELLSSPKDVFISEGNDATFEVKAKSSAGIRSYSWEYKEAGSLDWKTWTSNNGDSKITVGHSTDRDGMSFRCKITDWGGCTVYSETGILHCEKKTLAIVKQPIDAFVYINEIAKFEISAEGKGLKYLWQYQEKGKSTWVDWTSKTTPLITVAYAEYRNGMKFRCVVTDSSGKNVTSKEASLIYYNPVIITKQPESMIVGEEDNVFFSVKAVGKDLKYRWERKGPDATSWSTVTNGYGYSSSGSSLIIAYTYKSGSLNYLTKREGYSYRCIVTDSLGYEAVSDVAVLKYAKPFSITKQPSDVAVDINKSANFDIVVEGTGLKYLWQYKQKGKDTWVDWTTKTTASISVAYAAYRDGMSFRCVITDASGKKLISDEAVLTYNNPLTITKHPLNTTVKSNEVASFSVSAVGKGLKYLWQYKEAGKTSWTDWTTKTTANISVAYAAYRDGMSFRCVVTDSTGAKLTSNSAVLTYKVPFSITAQPSNTAVNVNEVASFSVKAAGKGLKYLWQYKKAGGSTWTDWTTKTTATISVAYASYRDGMSFRCVVTDSTGAKLTSNSAVLTYNVPFSITTQPTNTTVNVNGIASFSVKAAGKGLKYLWQYKKAGESTWTDWTTKTTATISVAYASFRDGMSFRCVVTDETGKKLTSNSATLTYNVPLSITTQPSNAVVNVNEIASVSVKAEGKGLKYLWQYRKAGEDTWTDWTSKTTATITVAYASFRDGMSFRCIVTDSTGNSITSKEATLTYNIPLVIVNQPANTEVDVNALASFGVKAEGKGLKYLWQYKLAGTDTWIDWTSKTTASITVAYSASRDGMSFRCVVTDVKGESITSDEAVLTYVPVFAITKQPTNVTVGENEVAIFEVAATGKGIRYYWYYQKPGKTEWEQWTNNSVSTISVPYDLSLDGALFSCVVSDAESNNIASDKVKLTYNVTYFEPMFTLQPMDIVLGENEHAELEVSAYGFGITYQWEYKYTGDSTWNELSGRNSSKIEVPFEPEKREVSLRCVVTDNRGKSVTSGVAVLKYESQDPTPDPDSYTFNGHSYKIFNQSGLSWNDAKQRCVEMGGHLVTITSAEEQNFINSINTNNTRLWIGATLDGTGNWSWVTGESWGYTNWMSGEPSGNGENCVAIWPETWNDMRSDNLGEQSGFICEWDTVTVADTNKFNGHTYEIVAENGLSWNDAKQRCAEMGGHLVTITSAEEQNFINSINTNNTRLWIGATLDGTGNWSWVTGESWGYNNWMSGEPSGNGENCAAIWPETWNDMRSDNLGEQNGFICEWDYEK